MQLGEMDDLNLQRRIERRERQNRAIAYGEKALKYMQGQKKLDPTAEFPTIVPGTAQWIAWERYFLEYLNCEPMALKRAREDQQGRRQMTVPTPWPEWLDSRFSSIATQREPAE